MMLAYYFFRDLQDFFEILHKEDFVLFFDCKEEAVLNIRILYSSERFERLKTLFEAFRVDRDSFIQFYTFDGTYLRIVYNFLGVEE